MGNPLPFEYKDYCTPSADPYHLRLTCLLLPSDLMVNKSLISGAHQIGLRLKSLPLKDATVAQVVETFNGTVLACMSTIHGF